MDEPNGVDRGEHLVDSEDCIMKLFRVKFEGIASLFPEVQDELFRNPNT